jgi:hypothetical protein
VPKLTLDHVVLGLVCLVFVIIFVLGVIRFTGLGALLRIYLDARTARKTTYEIRRLRHEERVRESPIQRATLDDVRRYDPTARAVDRTVEREEARERRKRWFEGLQVFVAMLTAIRELLDRIRRGGPPPEEGKR